MASIRPFRGVRYDLAVSQGLASVVSAPYDVITPAAQREFYERSPLNAIRLELAEESPADTPKDNRYTRTAAQYRDWHASGVLRPDTHPVFYLYDEEFVVAGTRLTRRSLLAPVRLARFDENVILPHEHTFPKAKADRLRLLQATHTQFSPLLGFYAAPGAVADILARVSSTQPTVEFTLAPGTVAAAAVRHRLWAIESPEQQDTLAEHCQQLQIFIADGHHRYETALTYRDEQRAAGASPNAPSEYALFALVALDDPGLVVFPTHRLVRGLGTIDRPRVLAALDEYFVAERLPTDRFEFSDAMAMPSQTSATTSPGEAQPLSISVLGLEPGWVYRFTLRRDVDLATVLSDVPSILWRLDTMILRRLIFERALGLASDGAAADERIQYTRDPAEALSAFHQGEAQLVFFLNPTPVALIREATRAGVRMPEKTTYFYPKPVTGLVFFDHAIAWPS